MIVSAETLLTGDGKTVIKDGGVLIEGGVIRGVGKTAELLAAHISEEHADYGAATLLPGLIDMHVHLSGSYRFRMSGGLNNDHMIAYLSLNNAQRFLKNGVTCVRDVFGPDGLCMHLAVAKSRGLVQVPRIFYCNKALTVSGGIDWSADGTVETDGPEDIRRAVREQVRTGADWIKAMCDARTPGLSEFDQDELNMIVSEAHRRGRKAAAHANMQPAIQMCIDAGFDTIEHASHLTLEQARQMAENGQAVVSTAFVYEHLYNQLRYKQKGEDDIYTSDVAFQAFKSNVLAYRENYPKIYDTGLTVVAGTDCGFDDTKHITVAWELEIMTECGMPPVQAVASATSKSAKLLGMEGRIGILAEGAAADLLIADANADKDITALKRVKEVYQDGKRLSF